MVTRAISCTIYCIHKTGLRCVLQKISWKAQEDNTGELNFPSICRKYEILVWKSHWMYVHHLRCYYALKVAPHSPPPRVGGRLVMRVRHVTQSVLCLGRPTSSKVQHPCCSGTVHSDFSLILNQAQNFHI